MRDALLRQQKDRWLTPVAEQRLATVQPNLVSLLALLVGLCSIIAILHQAYWAGLGLWLLNRTLDGLDGLVARLHNKQSDFGGYLDLFFDFLVYLGIPIAFTVAQSTMNNVWAGMVLFAAYYLNTMSWTTLSALLEKRRLQTPARLTSLEMPAGLIEGAETVLLYSLFYLLPGYLTQLFSGMALLVFFTAGQRLWWAYWHIRELGCKRRN